MAFLVTYLQIGAALVNVLDLGDAVLHAEVDDLVVRLDLEAAFTHVVISNWRSLWIVLFNIFYPLAILIENLANALDHLLLWCLFFSFSHSLIFLFLDHFSCYLFSVFLIDDLGEA